MKQLDWSATEERARTMSDAQLNGALADILKVLPNVRAIERAGWLPDGAKSEGYYCDEASVYRAELRRRSRMADDPVRRLISAGDKLAEALTDCTHPALAEWNEAVVLATTPEVKIK